MTLCHIILLCCLDPGRPSHVRDYSTTESSVGSIQLIAQVPSERDCGQITDYAVRDSNHSRLGSTYSVANGNVTVTIVGLEAGRQYAVQVSAINSLSWEGPPSELVTFNTSKGERSCILHLVM